MAQKVEAEGGPALKEYQAKKAELNARLQNLTTARSEVLQRLGSALARTGQFAAADETLGEAVEAAKSAGDRGNELRALIERMTWRVEAGAAKPAEAVELARAAIPVFERLGDELGLAKAWHLTGDEHVVDTWAAGTAGLERALVHARRAGDQYQRSRLTPRTKALFAWLYRRARRE